MGRAVFGFPDLVDGQRYAVERDRAFLGDHRAERARNAEADLERVALGASADDRGDRIDVAGDDMPAELIAQAQRAFEVELRALLPVAARRFGNGFARHIDREPVVALVNDGQADARTGDGSAEIDGDEVVAGRNLQAE